MQDRYLPFLLNNLELTVPYEFLELRKVCFDFLVYNIALPKFSAEPKREINFPSRRPPFFGSAPKFNIEFATKDKRQTAGCFLT